MAKVILINTDSKGFVDKEKWTREDWNKFYNGPDYLGYKIKYVLKGYEVKEDGDELQGSLALYYKDRLTLKQEWHSE